MTLKFPTELIINGDEWKIQPFRFNVHAINTGSYTPSYRDVTVTGVSPLNLPNAEANGLRYIKLYGKCEQTPNLFDKDTATLNYFINSSGEEQYNASWACTDYIQVVEGGVYKLTGITSYGSSPRTGFYAADKSFVSARSQSSSNFTIPENVKYMRMSIYKTSVDTAVIKQILSMDNPIPILCNNGEVGSTGFTVVGSPTISSDLVVSGFSSSNYLNTIRLSRLLNKSWTIKGSFSYESGGCLLGFTQTWAVRGAINYGSTGNVTFFAYCGTTGDTTAEGAKITLSSILTTKGAIYTYELSFNYKTGQYTLSVYNNAGTLINTGNYTPPTANKQLFDININPATFITIGKPLNGTSATNGIIDLKSFKITINDVPVRLPETVSLNDQTAVARDLLSCGDNYVDEQNITTGEVTRKVGYKIFDGTENWNTYSGTSASGYAYRIVNNHLQENTYLPFCTHFKAVQGNVAVSSMKTGEFKCLNSGDTLFFISDQTTLENWKNYLAAQYSAGTPVIVVYPLATSTTETVAAQTNLQTIAGNNTLTITQAAIDGLQMEVTYSAGVEVTIEAVQNANVDQTVEVTIGE